MTVWDFKPATRGRKRLLAGIRGVNNGVDPVVGPGIMASRGAASAGFRLFKLDRNAPSSVGDLFTQVFGLIACVGGVAGTAGPSPFRHIHVQVMKVQRSFPEIGQTLGFRDQNDILIVTGKTEVVDQDVERRVELRRILPDQQSEIIAPVRRVAIPALPIRRRPVGLFKLFQFLFSPFMTRKAELSLILDQQVFEIRAVAIVALRAFAFGNGLMSSLYVFIHFMALDAHVTNSCR